jgi:hypothetical protein
VSKLSGAYHADHFSFSALCLDRYGRGISCSCSSSPETASLYRVLLEQRKPFPFQQGCGEWTDLPLSGFGLESGETCSNPAKGRHEPAYWPLLEDHGIIMVGISILGRQ